MGCIRFARGLKEARVALDKSESPRVKGAPTPYTRRPILTNGLSLGSYISSKRLPKVNVHCTSDVRMVVLDSSSV